MKSTSLHIGAFALPTVLCLLPMEPVQGEAQRVPQKAPRFDGDAGIRQGSIGGLSKRRSDAVRKATQKGLEYLVDRQAAGGFWRANVGFKVNADYSTTKPGAAHVGITALAIMAFLAQGHVPGRGKYGKVVRKAVDYLVLSSNENGYLSSNGTKMYSHAFATLALAEVYGMTRSKEVRKTLQRSIDLIAQCQNREGGWRYKPFAQESDISITVCQVMALRAARNSGIYVQKNVIRDAVDYVRRSDNRKYRRRRGQWAWRGMDEGVFKYQIRDNARASFTLTAAGVTTLYGAGIYKDVLLTRGLSYMREHLRDFNSIWKGHYFFYYGNYYAVQAFYYAGGKYWNDYYRQISKVLLDFQNTDGSWPNHTGPGTNFSTAVATLILSIPYQYLPIFQR